jgi:hypothetical protein
MGQWKIVEKSRDGLTDAAMTVASLGLYALSGEKTFRYLIENRDTGERKSVKASDEYELGDIISEGDFED